MIDLPRYFLEDFVYGGTAMEKNTIILSLDQMKAIARYEMTFMDIIKDSSLNGNDETSTKIDIMCPEIYSVTLDDLYHALLAMKEKDPTAYEAGKYWLYPIQEHAESFNLESALTVDKRTESLLTNCEDYPGLPLLDCDYFEDTWWLLENSISNSENNSKVSEALDLDEWIERLEVYFSNKGKPIREWVFLEEDMQNYLSEFLDTYTLENATDDQLAMCRRFADILAEKDNEFALRIRDFGCFDGKQ